MSTTREHNPLSSSWPWGRLSPGLATLGRQLAVTFAIYTFVLLSAVPQVSQPVYDAELLNTSNTAHEYHNEFRGLWMNKYPELFQARAGREREFFPEIDDFLVAYVMADQDLQVGRTGIGPVQHIKNVNSMIDRYIARNPTHPIPEVYEIKRRINFETYSDSAFTRFVKRLDDQEKRSTSGKIQGESLDRDYRTLMNDPYFGKKQQLQEAKVEFDAWRQGRDTAAKATVQNENAASAAKLQQPPGEARLSAKTARHPAADAVGNPQPANGTTDQNSIISSAIPWAVVAVLLASIILSAKGQIVFFADYTDATMTFLGPIALIAAKVLAGEFAAWAVLVFLTFLGFRISYVNNRTIVLATMSFISKYVLSVGYLVIVFGILTSSTDRRKGESAEAYELRRQHDERINLTFAAILTAITAFLVHYLVRDRRFSPFGGYFSTDWSRHSGQPFGATNASQSAGDDSKQTEFESHSQANNKSNPAPSAGSVASDPYAILGVLKDATDDEIKAAYWRKMQEYHPDKVAHLGSELRDLAARKAEEINCAHDELLSGAASRATAK